METEKVKDYLMRLVVIHKELSKLSIESLKRGHKPSEEMANITLEILNLASEEEHIISCFELTELSLYYMDYGSTLTREELSALSRVLLQLQVKKHNEEINEERGR